MGTLHAWESFGDGISVSYPDPSVIYQLILYPSLTSKLLLRDSEEGKLGFSLRIQ